MGPFLWDFPTPAYPSLIPPPKRDQTSSHGEVPRLQGLSVHPLISRGDRFGLPYTGAKTLRRSLATVPVPPLFDTGHVADAVPGSIWSHWRGVLGKPSLLEPTDINMFQSQHRCLATSGKKRPRSKWGQLRGRHFALEVAWVGTQRFIFNVLLISRHSNLSGRVGCHQL